MLAEKLGRETSNYDFKCVWGEIAIEWHVLANRVASHEEDRRLFETLCERGPISARALQ